MAIMSGAVQTANDAQTFSSVNEQTRMVLDRFEDFFRRYNGDPPAPSQAVEGAGTASAPAPAIPMKLSLDYHQTNLERLRALVNRLDSIN